MLEQILSLLFEGFGQCLASVCLIEGLLTNSDCLSIPLKSINGYFWAIVESDEWFHKYSLSQIYVLINHKLTMIQWYSVTTVTIESVFAIILIFKLFIDFIFCLIEKLFVLLFKMISNKLCPNYVSLVMSLLLTSDSLCLSCAANQALLSIDLCFKNGFWNFVILKISKLVFKQ